MLIRTRLLLLLIFIPMGLVLLFSFFFLQHGNHERREALEERITASAILLAPSLQQAIIDGQETRLQELVRRLLNIEEIRAASLFDSEGETILRLGQPLPTPRQGANHQWQLRLPLGSGELGDELPARLELAVDTSSLALSHYHNLTKAGLAWLITGLALFLAAYLIIRRVTRPLDDIRQLVRQLNSGNYGHRLDTHSSSELAGLSHGINSLADRLEHINDDMQRHIEQTTHDLQESMDTIEIKNIELDMAHRRALEANRIKSEFLANMSHEIRTPLNGIIGFCQLLARSPLEARQREWLNHVSKASDSLLSLINDILDFSKLEAGKMQLENLPLDMVALVDEVLCLQAPQAHQKSLYLMGLVYDDVPDALWGDPMRIKQVLTNLVHNAIKFTHQGEVIVRVMVEDADSCQMTLRVTVSDTGIGLSPSDTSRLFKAFSQASASDSRHYGGTGLGLMICRQLVEQMGGEIGVESRLRHGSTFAFTLPLAGKAEGIRPPDMALEGLCIALYEPHATTRHALEHLLSSCGAEIRIIDHELAAPPNDTDLLIAGLQYEDLGLARLAYVQQYLNTLPCPCILQVNTSPLELPDLHLPHGGEILTRPMSRQTFVRTLTRLLEPTDSEALAAPPKRVSSPGVPRVLIVDDMPSNRLLLEQLLNDLGLESHSCMSGEEALALAQGENFDLVLMDIRLPGMDGIATTQALRQVNAHWQHCPIIAVTAHAMADEHRQLHQQGFLNVLIKPVDHVELANLLGKHLNLPLAALPAPSGGEDNTPTVAAQDELAVVDMRLGTRLAAGREALAKDTLSLLLASLDDSEEALRRAWEARDEEAFLDAIHALNGACRYCGVPQLALLAETLETRIRTRGLIDVAPLLDELHDAMARLRQWQQHNAPFYK
ncbi:response regulator [Halomonas sp. PA5]|uniref:ATP-binding protein n=3 Tax=Halomonadaceae TaxID=28256 RepID=UPI00159A40AB|nr:response regulator [Halomonas sp. PA5]